MDLTSCKFMSIRVGWLKCQVLQQLLVSQPYHSCCCIVVQESEDPEDEDAPVITTMRWRGGEIKSV